MVDISLMVDMLHNYDCLVPAAVSIGGNLFEGVWAGRG